MALHCRAAFFDGNLVCPSGAAVWLENESCYVGIEALRPVVTALHVTV